MKLGFIGTGIIATALVHGFIAQDKELGIILSPRNAERAKYLHAKFPENITIASNNQEVVDLSEYVFLCVNPERAEEAIKPLVFGKRHKVFNLVAGLTHETIHTWIGDVDFLVHTIPFSFASHGYGPIVLYPDKPVARKQLEKIGEVFAVKSYDDFRILQALTSVQASFYTVLKSLVDWAVEQGLPGDFATSYTSSLFHAFTKTMQGIDREGLSQLSNEMTPKGLNWMTKSNLTNEKAIDAWANSLTSALERLLSG